MKRLASGVVAGSAVLALGASVLAPAQAVTTSGAPGARDDAKVKKDNRLTPQARKQSRLKSKARTMLENGSVETRAARFGDGVVEVAEGQFVETAETGTDKILTMLSEFGDQGSRKLGSTPGPLHNQIPEPDRSQDNSTYWEPVFDIAHYQNLFNGAGESMKSYYEAVSSGKYSVDVTVEDWVKVPGNASSYGDNSVEDNGGSWSYIRDTANAWYADQTSTMSAAQINSYLAQFDTWDRYDFDEDGNFEEPDGYIDHFQAVHAGEGEEAGADADAIWSHRWFAFPTASGSEGPTVAGRPNFNGGTRIGNSDYYIGDYTVEPENGGLGVFAHEYGHDLGLPDFYDTAGGENGTAFWTLMSSGSWLGHGPADQAIGTTPGLMGPEEKLYLGWLKYAEVNKGGSGTFALSPSQTQVSKAQQAVKVNLPDVTDTQSYVTPPSGQHAWWSGRGDDLRNSLTRTVPAASSVTVSASSWYQIEQGYDFLYGQYSTDNGGTWKNIGQPITGDQARWGTTRFSYKPGGQETLFRFRYVTDGGVNEAGAFLDDITVKADRQTFTDNAENGDNGWTVHGWKRSTGTESVTADRYYLLENRQYVGYDKTLQEGPYNFSEAFTRPNWVEHFPFQDGMLVWLVDQTFTDNNVATHPGEGYAMPVDATPNSFTYPDGSSPTNRREPFDATFGLDQVDRVCLHKQVAAANAEGYQTLETCAGGAGVQQQATFDDTLVSKYYDQANNPQNSVKVAAEGVKATVVSEDANGQLSVRVSYP